MRRYLLHDLLGRLGCGWRGHSLVFPENPFEPITCWRCGWQGPR